MSELRTPPSLEVPDRGPCPFCEYFAGRGEWAGQWAIVEDLEETLAFISPKPLRSGHVLVILKRHAPTILDLTPDELGAAMRHAQRVAGAVARAVEPTGLNVFQNNGITAGQSVPHYHVHVLPSYRGDEPGRFIQPEERVLVPLEDRNRLAARIAGRIQPVSATHR